MGRLIRWTFLFAVAFSGCTDRAPEWAGRIHEGSGVYRVENPVDPLAGIGEVSAVERWSSTGPVGDNFWEAPNKLHVLGDRIYMVDRRASRVHLITTDGELLPSLGEPGEGPGQYRRLVDAIPSAVGLFVVDGGNGRIDLLTDEGTLASSFRLERVVFSAVKLGEGAIAVSGVLGSEQGWVSFDASGDPQPIVFPEFEVPVDYTGPISSVSTRGEKLVRLRYTTPQLRMYSAAGELKKVVDIPLPMEVATEEEVEDVVREVTSFLVEDGLPSDVIRQQADRVRSMPREKLLFRKVVFDDDSGMMGIWEQNPEDFGPGPASLHLLSSDGIYLAAVDFPQPWADFALSGGVLYVLSRDPETDLVNLVAHDLVFPPGLLDRARELAQAGG